MRNIGFSQVLFGVLSIVFPALKECFPVVVDQSQNLLRCWRRQASIIHRELQFSVSFPVPEPLSRVKEFLPGTKVSLIIEIIGIVTCLLNFWWGLDPCPFHSLGSVSGSLFHTQISAHQVLTLFDRFLKLFLTVFGLIVSSSASKSS